MFFTQEDFRKIEEYLRQNSKKDTDFPYINGEVLSTEDKVAIIHDGLNKTTTIEDIFSKYNVEDISAERVVDANYNKSLDTINQELYEATSNNNIPTKTVITEAVKTDYVPIIRDGKVYLISLENLSILTSDIDNMLDNESEANNLLNTLSNTNSVSTDSPNTYTTPTVIGSGESSVQNGIRMFVVNINAINGPNNKNIKSNDYIVDTSDATYIVDSVAGDSVYCISNN